jgi:hypothetical protein
MFVTLVMCRDSSLAWLWELPELPGVLPCHDARVMMSEIRFRDQERGEDERWFG